LIPGKLAANEYADGMGKKTKSSAEKQLDARRAILRAYESPIEIYGKAIDQFGHPVAGASIKLIPIDRPAEASTSEKNLITDGSGRFSAIGLIGSSMGVSASKDGYLEYPPISQITSSVMLGYSDGTKSSGHSYTNPETPLVLVLHKIGPVGPMMHVEKKRWKLPLDGTTRIIALNSEKGEGKHLIEFRFKSDWNKLPMDNEINSKQFDWSLEIRIPKGGLAWDRNDANFEAPATGYREAIRYEYKATMPREKWKRMRYGRYFVKFADGTYGRIQFDIDGGSDRSPLSMESWLSLKPGSRNLATENMTIKKMDVEEPVDY
jgi:hypothetical protein